MHVGGHQAEVQLQVVLEKVGRQDWDNVALRSGTNSGRGESEKGYTHRARSLQGLQDKFECEQKDLGKLMQEFRSFKKERSIKREGEFCHWMGCCYKLPTVLHQRSFRERLSGFIFWGDKQQKISQTNSVNITFPQKVDFYAIFNRFLVMISEREKKQSCSAFPFAFRGIACLCDYFPDLI